MIGETASLCNSGYTSGYTAGGTSLLSLKLQRFRNLLIVQIPLSPPYRAVQLSGSYVLYALILLRGARGRFFVSSQQNETKNRPPVSSPIIPGHGADFYAMMDRYMPGWKNNRLSEMVKRHPRCNLNRWTQPPVAITTPSICATIALYYDSTFQRRNCIWLAIQ